MNPEDTAEYRGVKWHADRTINIANIIAIIALVGTALVWINAWMVRVDSRVSILEIQQMTMAKSQDRIAADLRESSLDIKTELRENQRQVAAALVRIENRQIINKASSN